MDVFHYARLEDWQNIKRGSYRTGEVPGLDGRIIGTQYQPARQKRGVFALTEPLPESWLQNTVFPGIWDYLRHDIGSLLLKIDVDPDKAHMLERGHMEGFLFRQASIEKPDIYKIPKHLQAHTRVDAERAYVESLVTISEYTRSGIQYCIPEVFIEGVVPFEKIAVADEQPYLLESVSWYPPYGEHYRRLLRQIPEVSHLAEQVPVERKKRRKRILENNGADERT